MKLFSCAAHYYKYVVVGALALLSTAPARAQTAPELVIAGRSAGVFTRVLLDYETPIQARFTMLYGAQWWNCIAAFSPHWKDTLTKKRGTVVVPDETLHVTRNRAECGARAFGKGKPERGSQAAADLALSGHGRLPLCGRRIRCVEIIQSL